MISSVALTHRFVREVLRCCVQFKFRQRSAGVDHELRVCALPNGHGVSVHEAIVYVVHAYRCERLHAVASCAKSQTRCNGQRYSRASVLTFSVTRCQYLTGASWAVAVDWLHLACHTPGASNCPHSTDQEMVPTCVSGEWSNPMR